MLEERGRAWDLETIPNPFMENFIPEPKPNGRLKDPEKIRIDIAIKKKEAVEKMALSPLFGRIATSTFLSVAGAIDCGYDVDKAGSNLKNITSCNILEAEEGMSEEDLDMLEIHIIKSIFNDLFPVDANSKIITWNGSSFDFPFLYLRGAILKKKYPAQFTFGMCEILPISTFTKRYSDAYHIDLPLWLNNWAGDAKYTSLDSAAFPLLGKKKLDHDNSQNGEMILNAEGRARLLAYNIKDCMLPAEIYETLKDFLF